MSKCSFAGCDKNVWANGWCSGHNNQLNRGEALRPLRFMSKRGATLSEKAMDRVTPEPNSGCWLYHGSHDTHGYPRITDPTAGRMVSVVRLLAGVPKDKWANHKCNNPGCVNPAHVYAGTPKQNTHDMIRSGRAAWQTRQ